ncbi:MAG: electron transfer flavoprotein subunit beta/FixA family protein [Bacillota bacterium]|jgi:electron transfer flavoprotein beta subunit
MRIIVCVKQVPASSEVKLNQETNTIIREGIAAILNPFDAHALEEGLRLRECLGGEVITLSMGIPSVKEMLQGSLALGADRGVLLSDRAFAGADTLATATALAAGIRNLGLFDLVICGKQATDGDTAQVGPSLAEKLGVPHLTYVRRIEHVDGHTICCNRQTDDGHETVELTLPAVITVVREINLPRLPSIAGLRKAQNGEVTVWTADDVQADRERIGLQGSPTQVKRTFVPNHEVEGEVLTGPPEAQAERLIAALAERRLLPGGTEEVHHGRD